MKTTLRILHKYALLGFLCLSVYSCDQNASNSLSNNILLAKCWTHSMEEELVNSVKVYRPCDFTNFPASRFRNSFDLKENGDCNYSKLGTNDVHASESGKWEYIEASKTIIFLDANGSVLKVFEILELTQNKLVLK